MRPLPSPSAGLPRCSNHHAYVPCPLPRRIGTGAFVDCFPVPRGLPQTLGGSASALSFSRPAQASLALRPARLLNRPRRPLSRGFDGAGCPATPPVSYQLNRQLAGWNPPPQVIRASEAHQRLRTLNEPPIASAAKVHIESALPLKANVCRPVRRLAATVHDRCPSQRARCDGRPILATAMPKWIMWKGRRFLLSQSLHRGTLTSDKQTGARTARRFRTGAAERPPFESLKDRDTFVSP